jgi:hypothetical protein
MEPQENKQLALQKAISAHEQAGSALTDLMGALPEERYVAMTARIDENIAALREQLGVSRPEDHV